MVDFTLGKEARARQNSVIVEGEEYPIHTEFCWWLTFEKILNQIRNGEEVLYTEFDKFYTREPPENKIEGYKELQKFYLNEQSLPRSVGRSSGVRTVDWYEDSERIRAAFLWHYNIDLMAVELHWHDFQGLFNAVFWPLEKVVEARLYKEKIPKGAYEKSQKENREMWALRDLEKKEPFKMR